MEIGLDEDMVQTDSGDALASDFNNIIGRIEDIVVTASFQVKRQRKIYI